MGEKKGNPYHKQLNVTVPMHSNKDADPTEVVILLTVG